MRLTIAQRKHKKRALSIKGLERTSPEVARREKGRLLSLWAREVEGRLRAEVGGLRGDGSKTPTTTELIEVARLYGLEGDLLPIVTDAVRRHLGGPGIPSISQKYVRWRAR